MKASKPPEAPERPVRTAAAYIRVSTEEQLEFSPDSQLKKIREYARDHQMLLPDSLVFLDEGISGRFARNRPAFLRMIQTARQKPRPFDLILVWKFSRFARSRQDSIFYKSMLRRECGVDVCSVTEQLSEDPSSMLVEALLEAMDEYYSINLAQEVRRGMNEKFSRGGIVTPPPFGYRMGQAGYEPDEAAAPWVRMIFSEYLSGRSFRQIAARLNDLGIRTLRGNAFEPRAVRYILENPVYAGRQRRRLDGTLFSTVPAGHVPLISEEMFQEVRQKLSLCFASGTGTADSAPAGFMLKGLVRCSFCKSTLTYSPAKRSLQCCRYARGLCPQSHSVSLERLNALVEETLNRDFPFLETLCISPWQEPPSCAPAKEALLLEEKRLRRCQAAYQAGVDSLEEYQLQKRRIKKRIAALKAAEKKDRSASPVPEKICTFQKLFSLLSSQKLPEDLKNTVLRTFVSQIVFFRKEGKIQVHYRIPSTSTVSS